MKNKKWLALILGVSMLLSACQSEEKNRTVQFQLPSFSDSVETIPTETDPNPDVPVDTKTNEITPTESGETTPDETSDIGNESDPTSTTEAVKITRAPEAGQALYSDAVEFTIASNPNFEESYESNPLEEQEIWNQDGLVITARGCSNLGTSFYELYVHVVNETGKEVTLSSNYGMIDGFETSMIGGGTIANGNTDDLTLTLSTCLGKTINLWIPHTFEISLNIELFDGSMTSSFDTPLIPVYTALSDQEVSFDVSFGVDIYKDDAILIKALYCDYDSYSLNLWFYVENFSDQEVSISDAESWYNGVDIGAMYDNLKPGSKKIIKNSATIKNLEDSGLTDPIEEIVLVFRIRIGDGSSSTVTEPFRLHVS